MKNIGYIICETATTVNFKPVKFIKEEAEIDSSNKKVNRVIAEGVLQTADEKNRNGRWYDHTELFPQLTAPRTLELLNAGYLRAECGHPLEKDLTRQQTIDGTKCCAKFLKLWTNGMDVMGQFKGTNNELGNEFDMDLREGNLPAWSLRALGSIENTRRGSEVKNLKVITWDQVIYPSHPGAYTKGLVTESGIALPDTLCRDNYVAENKGLLEPITNEKVIDYIKTESANFAKIRDTFDLFYDDIVLENGYVRLMDKSGDILMINLESYIHNEIMNYAMKNM